MTTTSARARRARVKLPRTTAESLRRGGGVGRAAGSTLIHGWLVHAARLAREGRHDLLPARGSAPSNYDGTVFYAMSSEESADIVEALRVADSSVRAVIVACVTAWEAADYNAIRMVWPTRSQVQEPATAA